MKVTRRSVLVISLIGCVLVWLLIVGLEQCWYPPEQEHALIEERLYLGRRVKEPPLNTNAVLNLCEAEDLYACDAHLWEPIRDAEPAPTIDWLRRMVAWIDDHRQAGKTVYVHCMNGVSRSGLVVVAYLMLKHHWSRDRALAFVRARRPVVRPHPAFMELLLEWERVLQQ